MDGCFYLLYLHFFYEYKTLILRYIQKRLLNIDNVYDLTFGHILTLRGKGRKIYL